MKRTPLQTALLVVLCLAGAHRVSHAANIYAGTATLTIHEGIANSVGEFDAYFDDTIERAETLTDPGPGNAPFTESPASPGVVTLTDPLRPFGEVPSPYPGAPGSTRSRQVTTLDFDSADVLQSWDVSSDEFAFVGRSAVGEQIAFTSMQRWTGPFTGVLLYGDFALRYTGSKLVLTSNIDFPDAAFAELGNPVVAVTDDSLTISGNLLMGGGLFVLDPSATPGTNFGTFLLTASLVLPGDFNRDQVVDAADYTVWRDNLGGLYTQNDYDAWRSNFGSTSPAPAAGAGSQAIPEPVALMLAAIALVGLAFRASNQS